MPFPLAFFRTVINPRNPSGGERKKVDFLRNWLAHGRWLLVTHTKVHFFPIRKMPITYHEHDSIPLSLLFCRWCFGFKSHATSRHFKMAAGLRVGRGLVLLSHWQRNRAYFLLPPCIKLCLFFYFVLLRFFDRVAGRKRELKSQKKRLFGGRKSTTNNESETRRGFHSFLGGATIFAKRGGRCR